MKPERKSKVLPWEIEPVLERHGNTWVVRDDLIEGGSKVRFLPNLLQGVKEVVFGGPCDGGAPLALSVAGRELGVKITLFYAARKNLNRRQAQAKANGAMIHQVRPFGYISHVQHVAKEYVASTPGAIFLPLGFDVPQAEAPFLKVMAGVKKRVGHVDEVWCACATGMMTRCLGKAFPDSTAVGVTVGGGRWNKKQDYPRNVILIESGYKDLSMPCKVEAPFPICPNYEAKSWRILQETSKRNPHLIRLFWNVIGLQ